MDRMCQARTLVYSTSLVSSPGYAVALAALTTALVASCVEKAWMKDASYFFTTAYCPELQRLYPEKSFWTPRGYQIFTPWRPETLPPASERGYLYVVEVGFKGNKAAKKFSDAQVAGTQHPDCSSN